ncbi:hypothetical protein D3C87_1295660 [compost metagenome]
MLKLPDLSVLTAVVLPFKVTLTPASGIPDLSVTFPLTVLAIKSFDPVELELPAGRILFRTMELPETS